MSHKKFLEKFWDGKADKEDKREEENPIKKVHTDLIKIYIDEVIDGRRNLKILDAGAGTGRFSLELANKGHKIYHLDISNEMIKIAKEKSRKLGINNIKFYQDSIDDLSQFKDNQFDLVLCLDSPISFCFESYEKALSEIIRVSNKNVIICVMNRTSVIIEGGVNFDLRHFGELKTVIDVYNSGYLKVNDNLRKKRNTLGPSWHAFKPDELIGLIERNNCTVNDLVSPATLARFVDEDLLVELFNKDKEYRDFLEFEKKFDSDKYLLGVGTNGAGGLLAVIEKNETSDNRVFST